MYEGVADPEDSMADGSPLSMAVRRGLSDIARLLAFAKADPNRPCPHTKEAPLRQAALGWCVQLPGGGGCRGRIVCPGR